MKVAILVGAGASFGLGNEHVRPHAPPLGKGLYPALQQAYPATWGSLPAELHELFADFETGMGRVWEIKDELTQQLLLQLSMYFLRFRLCDQGDAYSQLLLVLARAMPLSDVTFASLNYEVLLELAAVKRGLRVRYLGDIAAPSREDLLVLRPHGACTLMPSIEIYNSTFTGVQRYYEGGVRIVSPDEALAKFEAGYSFPAAMSLYAPGKITPVAEGFTRESRATWTTTVAGAELIITLGVAPFFVDGHVWQPILDAAAPVWFVGPLEAEVDQLKKAIGDRASWLAPTIVHAVDALAGRFGVSSSNP